ncbi:hypothetical protein SY88_00530 [Clostridiales bacterium PH28_bin88]|nr:hypothetical protein SY88_00530 [Clostridiales bacterium PH28_bin88]
MKRILWLLVIVPLVELYLLILTGRYLGAGNTVLLVLGTGVAGMALARQQGSMVLDDLRVHLAEGRMPGDQLLDGVLVLSGALLLLTPGLITDTAGFLCLFPASRRFIREWVKDRLWNYIQSGTIRLHVRR